MAVDFKSHAENAFSGAMDFSIEVLERLMKIRELLPVDGTLLEIGVRDGSTVKLWSIARMSKDARAFFVSMPVIL